MLDSGFLSLYLQNIETGKTLELSFLCVRKQQEAVLCTANYKSHIPVAPKMNAETIKSD